MTPGSLVLLYRSFSSISVFCLILFYYCVFFPDVPVRNTYVLYFVFFCCINVICNGRVFAVLFYGCSFSDFFVLVFCLRSFFLGFFFLGGEKMPARNGSVVPPFPTRITLIHFTQQQLGR